jgi:hypothetical protein
MKRFWNLTSKQWSIIAVIVAIITVIVGVVTPEIRRFFGLEKPAPVVTVPPSIAPLPSASAPAASAPAIVSEAPKKPSTTEHPTYRTRINGNGNTNQVSTGANSPNVNAQNGIAIVGNQGTVTSPTVNNFAPPHRRLSGEQKTMLVSCLKSSTGDFTVASLPDSEVYRYAQDWSDVFSSAGWTNKNSTPVAAVLWNDEKWYGIWFTFHGAWDRATQRPAYEQGSPEQNAMECVAKANVSGSANPKQDMATGRIELRVSDQHP